MEVLNLFKLFNFKIPMEESENIEGIETWIVSWIKVYAEYSLIDSEKCYQAFTDPNAAKKFKKSIEDAHKLLGNEGKVTKVTIEKQASKYSHKEIETLLNTFE